MIENIVEYPSDWAQIDQEGNVILDYRYITKIGIDSIRFIVCDDSDNCLESYLKINVL